MDNSLFGVLIQMRRPNHGFTLIECLLAASLLMVILAGTLELSRSSRRFFFRLKDSQEFNQEIWAAQDRLRRDMARAGSGLSDLIAAGLISGIEREGLSLALYSEETSFPLPFEIQSGSQIIELPSTDSFSRGQLIALVDENKAEIASVEKVEKRRLILSKPVLWGYKNGSARIIAVEKICYFLDEKTGILRRKVNLSPAQPLLENVDSFTWTIKSPELINISLTFNKEPDAVHEIKITAKNILLGKSLSARKNLP